MAYHHLGDLVQSSSCTAKKNRRLDDGFQFLTDGVAGFFQTQGVVIIISASLAGHGDDRIVGALPQPRRGDGNPEGSPRVRQFPSLTEVEVLRVNRH